jgi:hypothetical protein
LGVPAQPPLKALERIGRTGDYHVLILLGGAGEQKIPKGSPHSAYTGAVAGEKSVAAAVLQIQRPFHVTRD